MSGEKGRALGQGGGVCTVCWSPGYKTYWKPLLLLFTEAGCSFSLSWTSHIVHFMV